MITCIFREHEFNETQRFDAGQLPVDPIKISEAMTELGDWVATHHYSEAMPMPVYELRLSEDDTRMQLIRHKKPTFVVDTEPMDVSELIKVLSKGVEYLRKRIER